MGSACSKCLCPESQDEVEGDAAIQSDVTSGSEHDVTQGSVTSESQNQTTAADVHLALVQSEDATKKPQVPINQSEHKNTLMSQEDRDVLETQRVRLQKDVGLEDGLLLAHLRARRAITARIEEEITGEQGQANQVGRLLDLLQRGDSTVLDKFVYSLRSSGQDRVAEKWLPSPRLPDNWKQDDDDGNSGTSKTTDITSMSVENILERYRPEMMSELMLADGDLLAQLRARGVLTQAEENLVQTLLESKGNSNAVGLLVNFIQRKSPESQESFLHALIQTGYSHLVEKYLRQPISADIMEADKARKGGSSTAELEEALRFNLADRLADWKTALEEGISDQAGHLAYIDQPCKVKTKETGQGSDVLNAVELIQRSSSGERHVVYGEAGMGKTTLVKEVTRSWIKKDGDNSELAKKFKFVFLIPMRFVGNIPLLGTICDELELMPKTSKQDLERSMNLNQRQILFLLDSYEELRWDIAKGQKAEIHELIAGKMFPKSTVIVTTRPGSKLKTSGHEKVSHLEKLPRAKVIETIERHFGNDKNAAKKVLASFPALSFLQTPINLALFLFIIKQDKQSTPLNTQAELFSQVLQYMMLACTKKKKLEEFTPRSGSYLLNKRIPKDVRRLFREIAKKCYKEKKQNSVILHIEDADDLVEYLNFGLFNKGPDSKSVVLPHPLFQEYFAAAHLAEDSDAWGALYEQIQSRSGDGDDSQRPSLIDIVRPMGLNNVFRFLVALSQKPAVVAEQIGKLFVVDRKKSKPSYNFRPVNLYYYTEVIADCSDENGKQVLVTALLNAPVRDVNKPGEIRGDRPSGSMVLLPYLDYDQSVTFLKNVHNLVLCKDDGKSTLSCCGEDVLETSDQLVVTLIHLYDCTINTNKLEIRYLDLPARMLSRNITGARQLSLLKCTLREGLPEYMSDIDKSATLEHSMSGAASSVLEKVELERVTGLEHCDVMTSRPCQLHMSHCGDVRVSTLKTCFPVLFELEQGDLTVMVNETEEELTSWLSTVQMVRGRLKLSPQSEGASLSLWHILNIAAERRHLKHLLLEKYTLLTGIPNNQQIPGGTEPSTHSNTLNQLRLQKCVGDVNLCELFQICNHFQQLERIWVTHSDLVLDDERVESVKELPGLRKFTLAQSLVHTPTGRKLSKEEVKQHLRRLCPSIEIVVWLR